MNGQWIKGAAGYLLGRAQRAVGRLIGSSSQQAHGFGRQVAGEADMAIGRAEAFIRTSRKALPEAVPAQADPLSDPVSHPPAHESPIKNASQVN